MMSLLGLIKILWTFIGLWVDFLTWGRGSNSVLSS